MKFIKDAEPVGTSNGFWYDLADGGYIEPEDVLSEEKDIKKVKDALKVLEDFKTGLEEAGLLNEF